MSSPEQLALGLEQEQAPALPSTLPGVTEGDSNTGPAPRVYVGDGFVCEGCGLRDPRALEMVKLHPDQRTMLPVTLLCRDCRIHRGEYPAPQVPHPWVERLRPMADVDGKISWRTVRTFPEGDWRQR